MRVIRFLVVILPLLLVVFPYAYAQETMTATSVVKRESSYTVPYPGILPDNPLYPLKVIRDKLVENLIRDKNRKVEFYLRQTDKQMGMVQTLADKKNIPLAKQTALKAEHNFTQLISVYKASDTKPIASVKDILMQATEKHQEILANVIKNTPREEDKKVFMQVLDFSKRNAEEINKIYNAKKKK
jgi:hypothetical protein